MSTITKSIGTTGRDYSTMTLWEADLDNAGVYAAADDALGECYNDSAFDEALTINGGGTIGLNSVTLSVAAGQRGTGIAGTGARMVGSVNNRELNLAPGIAGTDKVIVEDLEWNANQKTLYTTKMIQAGSATSGRVPVIQRMIVHGFRSQQSNTVMIGDAVAIARDLRMQDLIVYDGVCTGSNRACYGIVYKGDQANGGCFNNTVHGMTGNGSGAGINIFTVSNFANTKIQNNIAMASAGTSPLDFKWPATMTTLVSGYNMSSDATADDPGDAGDLINQVTADQFVSLVAGSEDFLLKTGATAINAGVDLGTTPTGVNFDIIGYDRDAAGVIWDMGANEFISAVAVLPKSRYFISLFG